MPTKVGQENRGCVFFERGFEHKKDTRYIKKTQARCEGCSLWKRKRNKLSKKDAIYSQCGKPQLIFDIVELPKKAESLYFLHQKLAYIKKM